MASFALSPNSQNRGKQIKNGERTKERKKKKKKTIKIEKIQVLWKQKKIGNRIKLKGQDEEKKKRQVIPRIRLLVPNPNHALGNEVSNI